jgi:thioredoxin-disulfide reductase
MEEKIYDLIIIGGGVTGYSAAMYAGRYKLKTLLFAKELGGSAIKTTDIENVPGYKKISGYELFSNIKEHAEMFNIETKEIEVAEIIKEKNSNLFLIKNGDDKLYSKTIIFATGTKVRKLNLPKEDLFLGKGVHYCAWCDGPFYKEKEIAVIGGSDSAVKGALILSEHAKKVYLIHRGKDIRSEPILSEKIKNNPKIELLFNTEIVELRGDNKLNSVILNKDYNNSNELKVNGIFIEIGSIPNTILAEKLGIELNEKKEIIVDKDCKTNIKGVFAAGDCTNRSWKQIITGISEGVTSSYQAYLYISNK